MNRHDQRGYKELKCSKFTTLLLYHKDKVGSIDSIDNICDLVCYSFLEHNIIAQISPCMQKILRNLQNLNRYHYMDGCILGQ